MFDRICWLLISAHFLWLSFNVFTTGKGYVIYGYYNDYSDLKIIWGVFGLGGVIFFAYAIFGKFESFEEKIRICPKCEGIYKKEMVECPRCHMNLENLKGFYNRKR